jgi:sugar phosphate isomerase/epimerase
MDAIDLLRQAQALGVRVLQIADNMPLHKLSPAALHAVRDMAQELQIHIEVGTRGIRYDHLAQYIEIAHFLDSNLLRVVIDTADHQPDEDEAVKLLHESAGLLGNNQVRLAIENHDRFSARTFARIVTRVGCDMIGICLDTVNSFGALEGPEAVLDVLAPHVINLHIKDFEIQRASHMMGFTIAGRPAGMGRLNIPWLLERIQATSRETNAILELWTPPEPALDTTIEKEAVWAEQSIRSLRQWIPD